MTDRIFNQRRLRNHLKILSDKISESTDKNISNKIKSDSDESELSDTYFVKDKKVKKTKKVLSDDSEESVNHMIDNICEDSAGESSTEKVFEEIDGTIYIKNIESDLIPVKKDNQYIKSNKSIETIEDAMDNLYSEQIINFYANNKLFATEEHYKLLIKKIQTHMSTDIKSYRLSAVAFKIATESLFKDITDSIEALITSGYQMTNDNYIQIYEYFDIVVPSLKTYLKSLIEKPILSDSESKTLSKLAYLLVSSSSILFTINKTLYTKGLKSNISLVRAICAFASGCTEKQVKKYVVPELFTLDMLNVVIASANDFTAGKITKNIEMFKDHGIYPDYHTFRLLQKRNYSHPRNISELKFTSHKHAHIHNIIFSIYSQ